MPYGERVIVPQSTLRTRSTCAAPTGPGEEDRSGLPRANQRPAPTGNQAGSPPSSEHRDYADISRPGSAVTSADVFDIGIIRRSA